MVITGLANAKARQRRALVLVVVRVKRGLICFPFFFVLCVQAVLAVIITDAQCAPRLAELVIRSCNCRTGLVRAMHSAFFIHHA